MAFLQVSVHNDQVESNDDSRDVVTYDMKPSVI